MSDGGKGSKQRPPSISDDQMAANWGAINWNARDLSRMHGDALPDGEAHGAGEVQETDPPTPEP